MKRVLELSPMVFTEMINAPVDKVWKTLVNPNGWDPWFTDGMKVEMYDGGDIYFRWFRLTNFEEVTDRGYTIKMIENTLWEFWWYEYEDGFKSRVEIRFQPSDNDKCWVIISDNTLVKDINELDVRYGCAYGWGQMMVLAKAYIEKGLILLDDF